jgi:hypothetical protein
MKRRMPFCFKWAAKNANRKRSRTARSVTSLRGFSIKCSTATETVWIITKVMDSTSDVLSASICRDVNSAFFHFIIIICVVSKCVHLYPLSGLSHCRPGHIPRNFTSLLMTVITTDHSSHRLWDIPYNSVNCAVLTGDNAGLRTALFQWSFQTQNCAVHTGNPTVSSVYLPKPQWHHLKELNFNIHF